MTQTVVYRLNEPITIGAGRSAALPVFGKEIPGEFVCTVDVAGDGIARQSIELENATELSLLSGPLSIIRKGDFVGDAKLPRIDVKQKKIIDFGFDRPIQVKELPSETIHMLKSVTLAGLDLTKTISVTERQKVEIRNLDTEDRVVLLKMETELKNATATPPPERRTEDRLVYRCPCAAGQTQVYTVDYVESIKTDELWTNKTEFDLANWKKAGLTKEDEEKLLFIAKLNKSIEGQEKAARKLREIRSGLLNEQNRLRENLAVLKSDSDHALPTLTKFMNIEKQLDENTQSRNVIKEKVDSLKQQKSDWIQQKILSEQTPQTKESR